MSEDEDPNRNNRNQFNLIRNGNYKDPLAGGGELSGAGGRWEEFKDKQNDPNQNPTQNQNIQNPKKKEKKIK